MREVVTEFCLGNTLVKMDVAKKAEFSIILHAVLMAEKKFKTE